MAYEGKGLFREEFQLRNTEGLTEGGHQHFVTSHRMGEQAAPLLAPKPTGHTVTVTE